MENKVKWESGIWDYRGYRITRAPWTIRGKRYWYVERIEQCDIPGQPTMAKAMKAIDQRLDEDCEELNDQR